MKRKTRKIYKEERDVRSRIYYTEKEDIMERERNETLKGNTTVHRC